MERIYDTVVDNANHVKNTTQLLVQKSFKEIETFLDHRDDDWGRPDTYIHEPYPLRMNRDEGYALTLDNEARDVGFRISHKPYNYVRGAPRGSPNHLERVKTALQNEGWRVGVAELVYKHDEWRLHVSHTQTAYSGDFR